MLLIVVGALAAAPFYWLVPGRARGAVLVAGSLFGLALLDVRALAVVVATSVALAAATRLLQNGGAAARALLATAALGGLVALFVWNKRGGGLVAPLPSQTGLAVVGVSYLTLKAAAALVDSARGDGPVAVRTGLGWLGFLPTYTAGPMVELAHHRAQTLVVERAAVLAGLERVLIGLLKALVVAQALGTWSAPVIAAPEGHERATLVLALYAGTARFYLDFSGYSDVAIGLGALFGYTVDENFDRPLLRRNLVQLWQHWHMTLTRWLRTYVFVPVSRSLLRRRVPGGDRAAIVAAQLVTMLVCGLWHGLAPNFALWGLVHGAGLAWVAVLARDAGAVAPRGVLAWWRTSPLATASSTALTVSFFAAANLLALTDLAHAGRYVRALVLG